MITRQPTNQMITALQDVTFTCKAKGFDVKYEWKRHSGSVTGRRQSNLTISEATLLDEDQYYCVAMTEGGYDFSNNVTLRVNGEKNQCLLVNYLFVNYLLCTDSIIISQHPQNVTLSRGNKLHLSVTANGPGSDQFNYQWKKMDSSSLPSTSRGVNSPNLIIPSVNPSDSGLYYCVVTNQWGNMMESKKATVNVQCKLLP